MDFWRRKKEVLEPEKAEAVGESPRSSRGRSTALATRPIPEDALILIPLRSAVLFPGVTSPVTVGRASSVAAASAAVRDNLKIGFVLQRDAKTDNIGPGDLHRVGTAGTVSRYAGISGGAQHLMVQGERRFRVLEFLEGWPFLVASVAWIPEASTSAEVRGSDIEARFLQLKEQAAEAIHLLPNAPDELAEVVRAMRTPGPLADFVASLLDIDNEQKQEILETALLPERMDLVLEHLGRRVEVMRLSKEIGDKTKKQFDERQREHVLREQMRQIQKELGEGEEGGAEMAELKKSIDDAGMPE
ncbi:MAG: LON peptidase substrate-binding domain-containing protein, partial [Burkholderiales bacterium]